MCKKEHGLRDSTNLYYDSSPSPDAWSCSKAMAISEEGNERSESRDSTRHSRKIKKRFINSSNATSHISRLDLGDDKSLEDRIGHEGWRTYFNCVSRRKQTQRQKDRHHERERNKRERERGYR